MTSVSSQNPSTSELLRAFRQAKNAFYRERGAIGLLEFARFQNELPERIAALRSALSRQSWFSHLSIGGLVVVPRGAKETASSDVLRIGTGSDGPLELKVRVQLAPSPEFSTVEILYLWHFGGYFERLIDESSVGYRLKLRNGVPDRRGRFIYDHWQTAFERYREDPIAHAREFLRRGEDVTVVSTDISSFFDNVDSKFLLDPAFVNLLFRGESNTQLVESYYHATESLLEQFHGFRAGIRHWAPEASEHIGVPIGSLISRLIANVSLTSLDRHVLANPRVKLYRRYVDDLVIVAATVEGPSRKNDVVKGFLPQAATLGDEVAFVVPDIGTRHFINSGKTRVHELRGVAGIEFLESVKDSFSAVASERRAFVGNVKKLEQQIEAIEMFPDDAADEYRIPRLRDADRFTFRRYVATAFVKGLERVALLLPHDEAATVLTARSKRVVAVLDGVWDLDDFELVLSLLRVARICRCVEVTQTLNTWLAGGDNLVSRVSRVVWNGHELPRVEILGEVGRYLEARAFESAASVAPIENQAQADGEREAAILLRRTGLRYLDPKHDVEVFGPMVLDRQEQLPAGLRRLLARIIDFRRRAAANGDVSWSGYSALDIWLLAKPPTYMDVARAYLQNAEAGLVAANAPSEIDQTVDAIRGTHYSGRLPVFRMHVDGEIRIQMIGQASETVRVILLNLVTGEDAFKAAARGAPHVTYERLEHLDDALVEAWKAAAAARREGKSAILVIPELSLPRRWLGDVIDHAATLELSVVAGVEYAVNGGLVVNQAIGVYPTGLRAGAYAVWNKRVPAREESRSLADVRRTFATNVPPGAPRLVVESVHGRHGVLICSELLEATAIAAVSKRVEMLLVPAWNRDTSSFEHAAHAAASMYLHAFVCIANNAAASDTRIVAPIREPRHEREWCRIVHRGENRAIWADLPIAELATLHAQGIPASGPTSQKRRIYRPLPPDWT